MALAGGVTIVNCTKNNGVMLILQNERSQKRGDAAGTGKFVCEDKPQCEGENLSQVWKLPYINVSIDVKKGFDEVDDPRDGIEVVCNEICPFNTLRNKEG